MHNSRTQWNHSTLYIEISGISLLASNSLNYVWIEISDMAGNQGVQTSGSDILIDTTPPSIISIYIYNNATWATNETPSVICNFSITSAAGVDLSTAQYAFSTTGATSPTNWASVLEYTLIPHAQFQRAIMQRAHYT